MTRLQPKQLGASFLVTALILNCFSWLHEPLIFHPPRPTLTMEDVSKDHQDPGNTMPVVDIDDSASKRTSLSGTVKWTTTRVELWSFYFYYIVCTFYRICDT